MLCPKCGQKTKVSGVDSGTINKRFRKCLKCGYNFVTLEMVKADINGEFLEYMATVIEFNKKTFNT
ncbi:MAG: hypothetical protein LBP40_05310 [Campylobacteraceae bacterium]|jgi:transcriptional regulator NrdR family protein|nr:hypothetical protein [Campylobacteraceae bacterium]